MKYLGIDQSYTSSGLVIFDGDQMIHSEVFSTPKDDDIFDRAWMISEKVVATVRDFDVDCIAIEGLAFGMRGSATRDLAGLQFLIVSKVKQICNRPIIIVPPLTLKKFATKKGKATKKDMIAALDPNVLEFFKKVQGFKVTKGLTDITDAYFLAQYLRTKEQG